MGNGDYHANCYLHVYDVNPNNVRFNDGNCNYLSSAYLCQPTQKLKCASGSSGSCKITPLKTPGYSAGLVVRVSNGIRVRKSTEKNSCPDGFKIWSPRNKNDWIKVYNAMGKNINNYPKKPHLIVDVTRPANSCGGCTKYAMKSTTAQQGSWRTKDGSPWWLRDTKYNEPNGDYHANCYLHVYDVNPNNVKFNDQNCNNYSTEYLCQKAMKKGANPCAKNNGGCTKARKCSNVKGKAVCGKCPKGYTNLGAKNCKKTGATPKFSYAGNGKTNCGKLKPVSTEAQCKAAAKTMKKVYGGTGTYATWPKVCFYYNNKFYFNKHKSGKANSKGSPVCTTGGNTGSKAKMVVAYQTGDSRSGCPRAAKANAALITKKKKKKKS